MVQGSAFAQRNANHVLFGFVGGFGNCFRNFGSLTRTVTDAALLVTDDDNRSKRHVAAALDGFGDAVDVNQFFNQFFFFLCFTTIYSLCHFSLLLKFQTSFASGIGQSLDTAVENVTAAVKDHFAYTRLDCSLGNGFTDNTGCFNG